MRRFEGHRRFVKSPKITVAVPNMGEVTSHLMVPCTKGALVERLGPLLQSQRRLMPPIRDGIYTSAAPVVRGPRLPFAMPSFRTTTSIWATDLVW